MAKGGKLVIETDINMDKFNKKYNELQKKMESYIEEYNRLQDKKAMAEFGGNQEELDKINFEIENLNKKISGTSTELVDLHSNITNTNTGLKETNKNVKDIGDSAKDTGNKAEDTDKKVKKIGKNNFDGAIKSLKKFALGLIGIRGIYSMVRKASSAWLSQDTELAKKFQNVWLTLGAALAPILEWLADVMYKLLGYLNVFVKAFTGGKVDLIANANAKALQKQANAMKELKNQTYGFDELNIQQVNDNSGSSSFTGIPEIQLNKGVADTIGLIGEKLGGIAKWVKDNLGVGGAITLAIIGLIGVKALVGGSGLLGILAVILAIIEGMKWIQNNDIVSKGQQQTTEKIKTVIPKSADEGKTSPQTYLTNIKGSLAGLDDREKKLYDKGFLESLGDELLGTNKRLKSTIKMQKTSVDENVKALIKLAKQGKLSSDEIETLLDYLKQYYKTVEYETNQVEMNTLQRNDELRNELSIINGYINEINGIKTNVDITATDNATPTIQKVEDGLNNLDGTEANTEVDTEDNASSTINKVSSDLDNLDGKIAHTTVETTYTTKDKTTTVKQKITAQVVDSTGKALAITKNPASDPITYALLVATGMLKNFKFGATGGVLNKCAVGSIINNPGRGVYLGNNTIGGEAGKEGLIPLTDPNAMSELGETIARYIPINITNVTKLDSKILNKETKTISNDMNFIRNGGVA